MNKPQHTQMSNFIKYRIIDNNYQWSNFYKTKKEALAELKRQREYDKAYYPYALEAFDGYEWFILEWFK